jgi:ABC-type Fe3+-hydroxamate transport system substrate-binding protein
VRIVSLVPSASETLLAWGVEPIAVTRFCELGDRYPTVGGTKDPSIASIVEMQPDLVVMCDQENRREDFDALVEAGVAVHAVSILAVHDVGPQMEKLAAALGLDRALGSACGAPGKPQTGSMRVFVPIWRKPWMTVSGSTYGSSMLRAAGYVNVFSAHIDRYPTVTEVEINEARPERVLAPTEPYPFTMRQHDELVAFAPVEFIDGKDLFWWGVRTPDALERLQQRRPV